MSLTRVVRESRLFTSLTRVVREVIYVINEGGEGEVSMVSFFH